MGSAAQAVALLMAPGYQEAQVAAQVLEQHNDARRKVERGLVEKAMEQASAMTDPILVLGAEDWHPGVLGIVASRLAETLHKPALLLNFQGDRGRGSGRSAGTLNLRDALSACSDCLLAHGGHAAAVGLELERSRFDEFRERINRQSGDLVTSPPLADPDGLAQLAEFDSQVLRKLDLLGPFGAGNPRPRFVSRGVRVVGRPTVDGRRHDLRFRVAQGGVVLPARLRRGADRFEEFRALDRPVSLSYSPRLGARAEEGPVELLVDALVAES